MTPLASRPVWDLQAPGSASASARGFLGAFGQTAYWPLRNGNNEYQLLPLICLLKRFTSSGWVLLPVSLCSMRGIPRASPQDKTARTTITAQSWHRRGEDCFQPPQPASVGRNDRYNWASGFFYIYMSGEGRQWLFSATLLN